MVLALVAVLNSKGIPMARFYRAKILLKQDLISGIIFPVKMYPVALCDFPRYDLGAILHIVTSYLFVKCSLLMMNAKLHSNF